MNRYKGYYMITSRCNLDCDYCVLEDSPSQIAAELDIINKLDLIDHLYDSLGFRRLTFSVGKSSCRWKATTQFLQILNHIRKYRMPDSNEHLEVRMYTNALLLNQEIADAMQGVVDLVAINIDSSEGSELEKFGRKGRRGASYLDRVVDVMRLLSERGIAVKIHSVIGK